MKNTEDDIGDVYCKIFHTRTPDRYEPAVTVTAELTHTFNLSLDGGVEDVVEMVEVVEVGSLIRPLTWTVWRCLSGRVAR